MEKYIYQKIGNSSKWKYDRNTKQEIDKEIDEIHKNTIFRNDYSNQHTNECFDRNKITNRREEWVCKLSFNEHEYLNCELGKIINYQVSLKIPKKDIKNNIKAINTKEVNEGRGKIDLISKNDKTKTVYLIEVKVSKNSENPCKAVLEIYTYYNLLGGKKRINEFLNKIDCNGYKCKTVVLFEKNKVTKKNTKKGKSYEDEFNDNTGNVKEMAKDLGVECYSYEEYDYIIKKINKVNNKNKL